MDIAAVVVAEVSQIPDVARREALRLILVSPSRRDLQFDYSAIPEDLGCWVVAAADASVIVYCPAGFGGNGNDQWGVLDVKAASMGRDDSWFNTLDEAFIGSGLWGGARPVGFELK